MKSWYGTAIGIAGCAFMVWGPVSAATHAASEATHELVVCDDPGSPAHAVGIGLELLVKLELLPTTEINIATLTSPSGDNCLAKMEEMASAFAILDHAVVESPPESWRSSGDTLKVRPLLVASLWRQAVHFVIAKSNLLSGTIGDFALLSADQLVIDPALHVSASQLLSMAGITVDRRADNAQMAPPGALVEGFNRGATIGFAALEPLPSPAITEFLAKTGGRAILLELSERHFKADGTGWRPMRISADSYPHMDRSIETFGNTVMLVAEADVADETVYQITKIMFDNLPKLWQVHDIATRISIERALEDAGLPLHPGAARYYREIGVLPHEAGASKANRAND